CHSQSVHNEIDAFLKNLKTTVARENHRTFANVSRSNANKSGIQPAQFLATDVLKTAETVPASKEAYPVPAQARPPTHLFHFIMRYEGDGIIDANVADYLKAVYGGQNSEQRNNTPAATYSYQEMMTPNGPVCVPGAVYPPCTPGCPAATLSGVTAPS